MDVLLGVLRHVVVDHVFDVRDIQPAGRNIGGDQKVERTRTEVGHHAVALSLAKVAVDGAGGDAVGLQRLGQTVNADLGAPEDERAAKLLLFVEVAQRQDLLALGHFAEELLDTLGGFLHWIDSDSFRLAHVAIDDAADAFGHGRAEERRLAFLRHRAEDVFDVASEADVEHLVRLIEYGEAHVAEADGAALDMVDDAPGGADNDVDAALQRRQVSLDPAAADEPQSAETVERAQVFDDVLHLVGEFARGDEHHGLHFVQFGVDGAREREAKDDRLAGAGLGEANHIGAVEHQRQGRKLDRRRHGVTEGGDRLEARFIHAKGAERLG